MLISMLGTGIYGYQKNLQRFEEHADRISRWGTAESVGSEAEDVAGLLTAQRGAEANLAVIKTADQMLGSLIDILA